jgi:hypothetical protein
MKAARGLARPGPWSETGSTDALVWGRCQGSGSTPYQVTVDLTGPAFRCSCPSRKQPCKHALALLLLWVEGAGSVADVDRAPEDLARPRPPEAGGRSAGATDRPALADPEAQARRRAQRIDVMDAGIDDFERWLHDLVRQGLASARQQPYAYWDGTAARLVDAQLPGLAERVREMAGALHRRSDWADHLTAEAGRWFLAVRAWRRRDRLDPAATGDLRVVLGWPTGRDEVLAGLRGPNAEPGLRGPNAEGGLRGPNAGAGERVTDRWLVAGVHRTDDGRLQAQRTWLRGRGTGRWALVLDFAVVGGTLRTAQVTGSVVGAELALYAGSEPRRALFATDPHVEEQAGDLGPATPVAGALAWAADAVAANPWVPRVPVVLERVALSAGGPGGGAVAVEPGGAMVGLVADQDPWPALALTGGHPTPVFGEWEHGSLRVLTVAVDDTLVPL